MVGQSAKNYACYIYILTNPELKDMVKIGYAIDPDDRAKNLYKTGLPERFQVAYMKWVVDGKMTEDIIHKKLKELRINPKREFFRISLVQAKDIVDNAIDEVYTIYRASNSPILDDETRLIKLFRCMNRTQQDNLLREATTILSKQYSLDAQINLCANKQEALAKELQEDIDERLRRAMPPMEPWDYLDVYIDSALECAWPDGIGDVILGSSDWDEQYANALLTCVEEIAELQGFPEPSWFTTDDMVKFIKTWRARVLKTIEHEALS